MPLSFLVMLIGIILAASTGVIGASVTLLGVMALPAMMAQNYSKPIATGTIASAGTLGILIPPSIMLVIMSDQLAISLGDLFMGALFPGLILGALYIVFIVVIVFVAWLRRLPAELGGQLHDLVASFDLEPGAVAPAEIGQAPVGPGQHAPVFEVQGNAGPVGTGVFDYVVQRFLNDAEEPLRFQIGQLRRSIDL